MPCCNCSPEWKDFWSKAVPPITLSMLAFCLTCLSNHYCQFVHVTWQGSTSAAAVPQDWGIWNYEGLVYDERTQTYFKTCLPFQYNNNAFRPFLLDSKWRTAMAFAVLASVVGGVTAIWIMLAPFCGMARLRMQTLAVGCFVTAVCQAFTFLFLRSSVCRPGTATFQGESFSSNGCTRIWGSNTAIAAVIMWVFAACVSWTVTIPDMPRQPIQTQVVSYTETQQPDGTKVVTENTKVVPGVVMPPPDNPKEEP